MIARNERAQLDGQIALRLNEARMRQQNLEIHSPDWWYWKGKVEAYKVCRNLTFRAFKAKRQAKGE